MSWRGYSIFGLFILFLAGAMTAPLILSAYQGEWTLARAFGFAAIVLAVLALLISLANYRRSYPSQARSEFLTLFGVLALCPAFAALPMKIALPQYAFEAHYFEMAGALTTTGASIFDRPGELPDAVNLWRAMVAWIGGFVALIMAFALLAPRNLGGYEVRSASSRGGAVGRLRGLPAWAGGVKREAAGDRIESAIRSVAPIYVALTLILAVGFAVLGQGGLKAFASAMSLMSTSGVQIDNAGMFADIGTPGEVLAVLFLVLAATRHVYRGDVNLDERFSRFAADPELRLLIAATSAVTLWLFMRHWLGALQLDLAEMPEITEPLAAFWGAFFTALSFATTAGVPSASWEAARAWSGLGNPGLVLIGLAVMGGGIASTAGGVKLLRAYALYKHGVREMERLVRPSSISGTGQAKRGLRREGAQIAWVFLMLFLLALGLTMLALSLTGLQFELALTAAVAALSNTGPVFQAAMDDASWLTSLTPEARAIAVAAMILGRVETLALIAMLNPGNWR